MSRFTSLEQNASRVGALIGSLFVFLVWTGTEVALRRATNYPPLLWTDYMNYLLSSSISGSVIGAAAGQIWKLARRGRMKSARWLCLGTGAAMVGTYIAFALLPYFQPQPIIGIPSSVVVNGVAFPMWLFQILRLFISNNLPFLLSVLMVIIGLLWSSRRHASA